MIKFGTFALLLTLLLPAITQAEDVLVPKMILTDKSSRRTFTISQVVRQGAKMPEDIRVHMKELTANRALDLSKQITFNKIESSFDLTYFYVSISTDLFLVVPPDEDVATYADLIRSISFFDEAFDNKIPGDDEDGFSPKLPFLINKVTGAMWNLTNQEPTAKAVEPLSESGTFVVSSVKHKAEVPTFTIVTPPVEAAGPITVENRPGFRVITVPLADGSVQRYTDRRLPGLILCEELLRKPSQFRKK